MEKIPGLFYEVKVNVYFVVLTVLYGILFAVLYEPTYGYDMALWAEHNEFEIAILGAIVLVVLSLSRTGLVVYCRRAPLRRRDYRLWVALEWLVCCLFCDLFMCLILGKGFFAILLPVLLIGFSVGVFPYAVFFLTLALTEQSSKLVAARRELEDLKQGMADVEDVIQFVDDKGNGKLLLNRDAVFSVESAGNYVNVVYEDGDRLQRFSLRNSMKGVEALCEEHGLVRCHRSYYVNVRKIKLIRRDAGGGFAELQRNGLSDIPISKNYLGEVARRFSMLS